MDSSAADRANNPTEILDLVDEHDRVIGTVRKDATESDPSLVHREVAILIHRGTELLWQLRSAAKSVMPLTWDCACAGHVGAGDLPEAAAHRELREELGFDVALVAHEGVEPVLGADEVAAVEWCDEAGLARWRAAGRRLSPVACELAEAFWADRWPIQR